MKVFLPNGSRATRTVYVQPGKHRNDRPEWFVSDGRGGFEANPDGTKRAITIGVKFVSGVAEVDKHLGRYLIEERLAERTQAPPPPPKVAAKTLVPAWDEPEERIRPARRVYTKAAME